jgi:hypothetical protein
MEAKNSGATGMQAQAVTVPRRAMGYTHAPANHINGAGV